MADPINAKNEGAKFKPHPAGQFAATCVDTLNMGERVEQFPGKPERIVKKCGLVFRTGETNPENGEYIDVVREFTLSMGEKANLRQFLEQWRGKSYTDEEADAGVPLHKLVGVPALVTIEHRKSGAGRTYANIKGITPLPKQMLPAAPSASGYKRPEYLEERKHEYAEGVRKYLASINHGDEQDEEGQPRGRVQRVTSGESGGVGLPDPETDSLPF